MEAIDRKTLWQLTSMHFAGWAERAAEAMTPRRRTKATTERSAGIAAQDPAAPLFMDANLW